MSSIFLLLTFNTFLIFISLRNKNDYKTLIMNTITIRKHLESDVIRLGNRVKPLLGKNVEIVIREIVEQKPKERKWTTLGSVDLHGKLDSVNIRDLAHDD